MSMFRRSAALWSLDEDAAADTAQEGTTYKVIPDGNDEADDHQMSFRLVFSLTQSGGATSPTTDAKVQGSWDGGTTWVDLVAMTQRTADGTTTELKDLPVCAPLLRAVTALAGGTNPSHHGSVRLVSDGKFRLAAA